MIYLIYRLEGDRGGGVSVAAVACRDKRIGTDSQMFMGKLRERREGKIHSRNHFLSCALKHSTIPSATSLGVEYHPSGCDPSYK